MSIWAASLAEFRERLASVEPVPAGVSAAAVAATFGLGLLTKVLAIASRRKDFAGDHELAAHLLEEARHQSQILEQLADEDITAFRQYLDCRRRREPVEEALRKTIRIPLAVARTSLSGIVLCDSAAQLIHAAVAPDLATAKALLSASARSTLVTLQANLGQLPGHDPDRESVAMEAEGLLQKLSAHEQDHP